MCCFALAGLLASMCGTLPVSETGERAEQYRLLEDQLGYELIWRPRQVNQWPDHELIRLSQGANRPKAGPWLYNWVARRDPMFLVSGDLPRFAMMRTYRVPDINPPYAKLGDLRIRLMIDGVGYWLDETDPVAARFYPWGTEHSLHVGERTPVQVNVSAALVGNMGIGMCLTLNAGESVDVTVELYFGGAAVQEAPLVSSYLAVLPDDGVDDRVVIGATSASIEADLDLASPLNPEAGTVTVRVRAESDPPSEIERTSSDSPEGMGNRALFRQRTSVTRDGTTIRFLASQTVADDGPGYGPEASAASLDRHFAETKAYYGKLLAPFSIQTPDSLLDAAFYAGVLNLDYTFQPPAWLEGLHKWNSYLVNNYQVSAAIGLGWLERARDALLFLGGTPDGPGPNLKSDGSQFMQGNHRFEEGLPYFVLQLYRYWRATEDGATLETLWEPTSRNLERLLEVRDPDGNLLLNWHQGCNMLLYQADHLNLPGDAFSPTAMVSENLSNMAEMAEAMGETEKATKWRSRARYMTDEAVRRLWDSERGRFLATIDTQGQKAEANYYTDFVFPQLYGRFPAWHAWISLQTLDRTLWLGNGLMRAGNYMPPLFGNNQVHPVQMSEASEAYFRAGRSEDGARLLHAVARAATVLTDSPGSFPERMSDSGFGQPDYAFGNPAGAYVRAVISGLFGIERSALEHPLTWCPSIPAHWEGARLRVADVEMICEGSQCRRTYTMRLTGSPQAVSLRLPLYGHEVHSISDADGNDLAYEYMPHPGGGFAVLELPPGNEHSVRLVTESAQPAFDVYRRVGSGEEVAWRLPEPGTQLIDPQGAFVRHRLDGEQLSGELAALEHGVRYCFLQSPPKGSVTPFILDFGDNPPLRGPLVLEGRREAITVAPHFNADAITVHNFWGAGWAKLDLSAHSAEPDDAAEAARPALRRLVVGPYAFEVATSGDSLARLEVGNLSLYEQRLERSDSPQVLTLAVGRRVRGLEFLTASDFKVRLTAMRVGRLVLHYADGASETRLLTYGEEIDCFVKPFASATVNHELNWIAHLAAFAVKADPSRTLDSFDVWIDSADGNIGVLAANAVVAE